MAAERGWSPPQPLISGGAYLRPKTLNRANLKHTTRNFFAKLFAAGILVGTTLGAQAQCTDWINPTSTGGWTDFNTEFGGAPCDDGTGCPFNEITAFEIFADEAYAMSNIAEGGSYTFSACNGAGGNGTGGTAWDIEFTIIAPSGAIDASGLNGGSNCELTWTASESGTYLIVVSEVGACGNSANDATDNGFPAITCNGVSCAPPQPGCTTWTNPTPTGGWTDFNTEFGGAPCDDGTGCPFNEITAFEIFADEAYAMDNVAEGGTYTFSACNGAAGDGTGGTAWDIEFTIIAPSGAVDAAGLNAGSICELTWTASESGTYLIVVSEAGACGTSTNDATDNGFPAITCESSAATACAPVVPGCTTWTNPTTTGGWTDFNTEFGGAPCDDGTGCPFNEITAFEVFADEAYAMDNVAEGGTYTFSACNGAGGAGTGGTAWDIEFTIIAPSGAVDAAGLNAGSICELTWTASESGTYLIVVSEVGACGTSANDATNNGFPAITCESSDAVSCIPTAVGATTSSSSFSIFPNPTNGLFTISLPKSLAGNVEIEVLDIRGRSVLSTTVAGTSTAASTLDLTGQAEGTYFVRLSGNGRILREKLILMGR